MSTTTAVSEPVMEDQQVTDSFEEENTPEVRLPDDSRQSRFVGFQAAMAEWLSVPQHTIGAKRKPLLLLIDGPVPTICSPGKRR